MVTEVKLSLLCLQIYIRIVARARDLTPTLLQTNGILFCNMNDFKIFLYAFYNYTFVYSPLHN